MIIHVGDGQEAPLCFYKTPVSLSVIKKMCRDLFQSPFWLCLGVKICCVFLSFAVAKHCRNIPWLFFW